MERSSDMTGMATEAQTLAAIERFNEAFNRLDVEAVVELMTDDVVFENSSDGRFEGREAVRAVLTRAFGLMVPGRFDTEDAFASGERGVVLWTYTFDREAPEAGSVRGADVFRVRGGLVAKK